MYRILVGFVHNPSKKNTHDLEQSEDGGAGTGKIACIQVFMSGSASWRCTNTFGHSAEWRIVGSMRQSIFVPANGHA